MGHYPIYRPEKEDYPVKNKKRKKKTVCKECGKRVKNWIVYKGQILCFECYHKQ